MLSLCEIILLSTVFALINSIGLLVKESHVSKTSSSVINCPKKGLENGKKKLTCWKK